MASKQPKRKRPPKKTVEQNLSNINSAESERRCEVQRRHCTMTVGGVGVIILMSILNFSCLFELLHVDLKVLLLRVLLRDLLVVCCAAVGVGDE